LSELHKKQSDEAEKLKIEENLREKERLGEEMMEQLAHDQQR